MNKMIKNLVLIACTVGVVFLIPLFLSHDSPIPVEIPRLDAQEMAAKKEAAEQAERQAQKEARARRVYACKVDEDCIIVDTDPCGCALGPKGVTAINVNFITDFNAINAQSMTKTCPDTVSTERECSPNTEAVCRARTCKIQY